MVRTGTATRPPLTLRGRWEFELAATLTGVVIVERTGGDIYGGIDALNPIGISELGLALSVLNDRVTGTAYVRGKALGRLDAVIDAYVDTSGGVQIARNRPFRIDIDAVLPDLSWMGPLIGDSVQVEGSGSIKTAISGTPADPTADGQIRASGLRVAYVEQGLRLENGTLDANLEDGVLVVNELVFTGAPRIAPDDKRAAEAVSFETPGRLRTVARIALRTLTGSVGIQAERLPVLQRRDRWMVVSGEGGITLAPRARRSVRQVTGRWRVYRFLAPARRALVAERCGRRARRAGAQGRRRRRSISRSMFKAISAGASTFAARDSKHGWPASSISQDSQGSCWPKATYALSAAPTKVTDSGCRSSAGS